LAQREGVAAYVAAADLHLEQAAPERAVEVMATAARAAKAREERRQISIARERLASLAGRADEANTLLAKWKRSEDPCLRLVATQREQQQAMVAASAPTGPTGPAR
jgi:hypothetical protein